MSEGSIVRLPVSLLRRDGGTQIRAQISLDLAREYAEAMGRGEKFPPVEAVYDGTHNWVWDGFHRIMGAELIGAPQIDCSVKPGTRRDAILLAVGANASHGFRRTNADKRQAVQTLLDDEEWSTKSDRQIAKLAKVDPGMVGRLRPSAAKPQIRQVTRGGATFDMNVKGLSERHAAVEEKPQEVSEPQLNGRSFTPVIEEVREAAADSPRADHAFDFAAAQQRDAVMKAIATLAESPPAATIAAMWSAHLGRGVPAEIVPRATAWLTSFNDLFPAAEERRQQAVADMMEKL